MKTNSNIIEWVNFNVTPKGRSSTPNQFGLSYINNVKDKQNSYNLSIPKNMMELTEKNNFLRFGKMDGKVIMQFNNESGCKIYRSKSDDKNKHQRRIYGKELADFILTNSGFPLFTGYYQILVKELGNSSFMIDKIIYNTK